MGSTAKGERVQLEKKVTNIALGSSTILRGSCKGRSGRDAEGLQESVRVEAKVEMVATGWRGPVLGGQRNALPVQQRRTAVDFCGSRFCGPGDKSAAGLTEESGGTETMPVCDLGRVT